MGKISVFGTPQKRAGILGLTSPRLGKARVMFSPDLNSNLVTKRLDIDLKGKPWRADAPFTWRYRPPLGKRKFPVIDVFVAREVSLSVSRRPLPLGPEDPLVQIHRPQHIGRFRPDANPRSLIPAPQYSKPPKMLNDRAERSKRRSIRIDRHPKALQITNTHGWYQITVYVKDISKPAAYWVEVFDQDLAKPDKLPVLVIHSKNVAVEAIAAKRRSHYVAITALEAKNPADVPWQGQIFKVPNEKELKRKYRVRTVKPKVESSLVDAFADLADTIFGSIPFIGELYDFSQFTYASITGKDFFGRDVSRAELIALGAAVALPLGISARSTLRRMSKNTKFAGLDELADHQSFEVMEDALDEDVRGAVRSLDTQTADKLTEAAKEALKGNRVEDFFEEFARTVGGAYTSRRAGRLLEEVENGRIPSDLIENLEGFHNHTLQRGYIEDVQLRTASGAQPRSPIEWALSRRDRGPFGAELRSLWGKRWRKHLKSIVGTRKRLRFSKARKAKVDSTFTPSLLKFKNNDLKTAYEEYVSTQKKKKKPVVRALDWALSRKGTKLEAKLKAALGNDWEETLRLLRGDFVVLEVPPNVLNHFDNRMMPLGVVDYATLARANRFFGSYFEIDHLLEQRFWRNDPRIDSFTELEEGFGYTIPKNGNVASLMEGRTGKLSYHHKEKSRLLNELIPAGKETMFTPQQIYDAHVHVYIKLGAPKEVYGARLRDMFAIYQGQLIASGMSAKDVAINFDSFKSVFFENQFMPGAWPVP